MRKGCISLRAIAVVLYCMALGLGSIEAHELFVIHPIDLVNKMGIDSNSNKGVIQSSLGNFGFYDSHGIFRGRVHYPIKNQDGCIKFNETHFNHNHLKEGSFDGHKLVIMVDRGNCHFVKKLKNIQEFGAIMGIIVDYEEEETVTMANDGMGDSVKIPSFLIGQKDGRIIKETIHQMEESLISQQQEEDWDSEDQDPSQINQHRSRDFSNIAKDRSQYKKKGHQVIVEAVIDGKLGKHQTVEVDLWYDNIYELYRSQWNFINLARMADIFETDDIAASTIHFQPRALFLPGKNLPMIFKGLMCIEDGKYCGDMPLELQNVRNNIDSGDERLKYTSRAIIEQTLREQCVFDSLTNSKSHWFIYVKQLIDICVVNYDKQNAGSTVETDIKVVTEECHNDVINHPQNQLQIDKERYIACFDMQVQELERNRGKEYNYTMSKSFMDRDYMAKKALGMNPNHPSMTLNNITYDGDMMKSNDLFKRICSLMEHRPDACKNLSLINTKEQILREYEQEWGEEGSIERRAHEAEMLIKEINKAESEKLMMDKKATFAEIVLSLVILSILTGSILMYVKLYKKETLDDRMVEEVNAQVSQYFQLAASDPNDTLTSSGTSRTRVSDPDQN